MHKKTMVGGGNLQAVLDVHRHALVIGDKSKSQVDSRALAAPVSPRERWLLNGLARP